MENARRIVLILVLVAVFVILAQRIDQFSRPPATLPPTAPAQQLAEPVSATATPEGYPLPPEAAPAGPYPPPRPTPTFTPEGYQAPGG